MLFKGFKSFRPSRPASLALFLLSLLFATLGTWQMNRATEKKVIENQYQTALSLSLKTAIDQQSRFAKIEVNGHFDSDRHILLDNRIWRGRAGVHVFTPFYTVSGMTILVNRGWLPLAADRETMPGIPTPQHQVTLKGVLNTLPVPGRILGPADKLSKDKWPQLVTYLNLEDISASIGAPLEKWVIQLSKTEPHGFDGREWQAVFMSSSRHEGYAFQWYALLAASIIMWLYLGFRKSSGNNK
jgi:surfeit locus 1 family protein